MKYFTITELCHSSTADSKKINNSPTPEVANNLQMLIENILDPVREAYASPIRINSGYRCPALNSAIGGVPTSQHVYGQAADISTGDPMKNKVLFELIQKLNLPFDQLIDENHLQWVHVSYNPARNRRQVLHIGQ